MLFRKPPYARAERVISEYEIAAAESESERASGWMRFLARRICLFCDDIGSMVTCPGPACPARPPVRYQPDF